METVNLATWAPKVLSRWLLEEPEDLNPETRESLERLGRGPSAEPLGTNFPIPSMRFELVLSALGPQELDRFFRYGLENAGVQLEKEILNTDSRRAELRAVLMSHFGDAHFCRPRRGLKTFLASALREANTAIETATAFPDTLRKPLRATATRSLAAHTARALQFSEAFLDHLIALFLAAVWNEGPTQMVLKINDFLRKPRRLSPNQAEIVF